MIPPFVHPDTYRWLYSLSELRNFLSILFFRYDNIETTVKIANVPKADLLRVGAEV